MNQLVSISVAICILMAATNMFYVSHLYTCEIINVLICKLTVGLELSMPIPEQTGLLTMVL